MRESVFSTTCGHILPRRRCWRTCSIQVYRGRSQEVCWSLSMVRPAMLRVPARETSKKAHQQSFREPGLDVPLMSQMRSLNPIVVAEQRAPQPYARLDFCRRPARELLCEILHKKSTICSSIVSLFVAFLISSMNEPAIERKHQNDSTSLLKPKTGRQRRTIWTFHFFSLRPSSK